jgi:hypothetical protein
MEHYGLEPGTSLIAAIDRPRVAKVCSAMKYRAKPTLFQKFIACSTSFFSIYKNITFFRRLKLKDDYSDVLRQRQNAVLAQESGMPRIKIAV